MANYWILAIKDDFGGHRIKIAPDKVQHLNTLMDNNQPIKTPVGTYMRHQILSFNPYQPPPIQPSLAEAAAIAFGDPLITEAGEVLCAWVKEPVSAGSWNKYYSHFAAYQKIGAQGDKVMIAYRLPVHMCGPGVEKCSQVEAQACEKRAMLS